MHSFEVHSNESLCRKSGRLGIDQVYEDLYKVPYPINKVWKDWTITIFLGYVQEHMDIRWIKPYDE